MDKITVLKYDTGSMLNVLQQRKPKKYQAIRIMTVRFLKGFGQL